MFFYTVMDGAMFGLLVLRSSAYLTGYDDPAGGELCFEAHGQLQRFTRGYLRLEPDTKPAQVQAPSWDEADVGR